MSERGEYRDDPVPEHTAAEPLALEPLAAEPWTCRHIKVSNPAGPGSQDVPRLLRAVADMIERIGDVQVLDLVLQEDRSKRGPWTAMNIYYQKSLLAELEEQERDNA